MKFYHFIHNTVNNNHLLREFGALCKISAIFYKKDKGFDLLYAFLQTNPLLKMDYVHCIPVFRREVKQF